MVTKNLLAFLSLGILLLGIAAVVVTSPKVEAQAVPAGASLFGWAWSSNIGWIKFKSEPGDQHPFGVTFSTEQSTGIKKLAGEAWSSTIGWVKYNPGAGPDGYPDDVASKKDAQFSGTNIIGWARGCTVFLNGACSGGLKDAIYRGGWDGWLKMGGGSLPGGGVHLVGTQLTGFAWGGEVLGWVKFHDVWDGPEDCTGVCIDTGAFNVACTVSNPTPDIGQNVDFTVTTSGGVPSYLYNWQISNSGYNDIENTDEPNLTVTRSFNTPGTKVFSVNVAYGTYQQGKTGGANCAATVQVNNQNQNNLRVTVIGQGTISGVTPPITNTGPTTVYNFPYDHGTNVTLTGAVSTGGRFDWAEDCSGSNVPCALTMDQDHNVTVTFTNPPQFCLAVTYGSGQNSMRVNYQTQNLEIPHVSTEATVTVEDMDADTTNNAGINVPLSLNIQPLLNRKPTSGDFIAPTYEFNPSSIRIGESSKVKIRFADDGNDTPNRASPYKGNYQFTLSGGPGVSVCRGSGAPLVNFTYIDVREREQ